MAITERLRKLFNKLLPKSLKLIKVTDVKSEPYVFKDDIASSELEPEPQFTYAEIYCLGLLTEEAGEVSQEVGKSQRFGLDNPSPIDKTTPRYRLSKECGDFLAAVEFCKDHSILDLVALQTQFQKKYLKLKDPTISVDNHNRPLAPQPMDNIAQIWNPTPAKRHD